MNAKKQHNIFFKSAPTWKVLKEKKRRKEEKKRRRKEEKKKRRKKKENVPSYSFHSIYRTSNTMRKMKEKKEKKEKKVQRISTFLFKTRISGFQKGIHKIRFKNKKFTWIASHHFFFCSRVKQIIRKDFLGLWRQNASGDLCPSPTRRAVRRSIVRWCLYVPPPDTVSDTELRSEAYLW